MPGFFSNRVDFAAYVHGTIYLTKHRDSDSQQESFSPVVAEEAADYTVTSCLNSAYKLFRNNVPIVLITLYLLYKEFVSCKCDCANVYYPSHRGYHLEPTKDELCPTFSHSR